MTSGSTLAPLSTAAVVALQCGNKIEAIKLVRAEHGLDLKGAKDLVEAHLQADPALRASCAAAQKQGSARPLLWAALLLTASWLVYRFLLKG
jgi:hypothetical protein